MSQSLSIIIRTQDPSNIKHQNLNVCLPPPPDTNDLRRWHGRGQGRAKQLELHSHRLHGEETRSLESQITHKHKKNQRQHERKLCDS